MKKLLVIFIPILGIAQFTPPASQHGSDAIHKDSSIIKAWATSAVIERGLVDIRNPLFEFNDDNHASFGSINNILGPASGSTIDAISLGDGGSIVVSFDKVIRNLPGADFCIFSNAFSDTFLELAFVEVSSDGERYVRFPSISLTQTETQIDGFGSLDATKIHNLAGKFRVGFGQPFDLEDLKDSTNIDLNSIKFVRLVDVVGSIDPLWARYDANGNIINDPFPTPFWSGGFDLEAIGVIHEGEVNPFLNLSEDEAATISIYPNPASDKINISANGFGVVRLINSSGKSVISEPLHDHIQLDIHHLPSGFYFIQLQQKEQLTVKKIAIVR